MKSVWCDPLNSSWPAWDKFRKYSITRVYVDAREWTGGGGVIPRESRLQELVDGIHSQGFEAGIYRDPAWGGWTTPAEYAQLASKDITKAEAGTPKQIAYMHDLETHDVQWILAVLRAWRKPRPLRMTDVTWEPGQGGSWKPLPGGAPPSMEVNELLRLLAPGGPGGVYHQTYQSGMQPVNAERARADLVAYGFPDARLYSMYDGKYLPPAWDGCAFTSDRIPA